MRVRIAGRNSFRSSRTRDCRVKWSAENAADAGFNVTFIWDATRSVDPSSDDKVRSEFKTRNIRVVSAAELL